MSNAALPKPIYLIYSEGGIFTKWEDRRWVNENPRTSQAHAFYFADGSIFDCCNGWRQPSKFRKPIVRVPMGRQVV